MSAPYCFPLKGGEIVSLCHKQVKSVYTGWGCYIHMVSNKIGIISQY